MAKQRPRFSRKTGTAYTPGQTANYENLIRVTFAQKYPTHEPTDDPVKLEITAIYPIPKSWPKKKQLAALEGKIYPGKPDIDNIQKIVQDAGNNLIWSDDARIHEGRTAKIYGTRPGLTVLIEIEERGEE